jgi:site-specific recombinase XerD
MAEDIIFPGNQTISRASERRNDMGLYRRGPTWWISFSYSGKQVRHSTETDDKKLAEKIYHKVMTEVAEGKWFDRPVGERKTFGEMMEKYMVEHSRIKKRSASRDEVSLLHLLPFFGPYYLKDVSPSLISSYKAARLAKGASSASLNRELALMKHAFTLTITEWQWVNENPVKKVSMEKEPPARDRWLTDEEEEALLGASPEWLREIVVFALDTGCRRAEALSLVWQNVNLETGVATVFGKKTSEWRSVPLIRRVREMLSTKHANQKVRPLKEALVFLNPTGQAVNIHELRSAFEKALDNAGINNFRFHDLRHTFATRLAQNGVDLFTIQKLLGHTTFATTQRYAHHYTESLRRGINVLDAYVEGRKVREPDSERQEDTPKPFITILSQKGENTPDFQERKS